MNFYAFYGSKIIKTILLFINLMGINELKKQNFRLNLNIGFT
jgi:hypothetical protein